MLSDWGMASLCGIGMGAVLTRSRLAPVLVGGVFKPEPACPFASFHEPDIGIRTIVPRISHGVIPIAPCCDCATAGFGGQKFIESQLNKIRRIRQLCAEKGVNPWLEVDGGVTPANAYKLIDAGANALVAGSAVFGAKDYAEGRQHTLCWLHAQCHDARLTGWLHVHQWVVGLLAHV